MSSRSGTDPLFAISVLNNNRRRYDDSIGTPLLSSSHERGGSSNHSTTSRTPPSTTGRNGTTTPRSIAYSSSHHNNGKRPPRSVGLSTTTTLNGSRRMSNGGLGGGGTHHRTNGKKKNRIVYPPPPPTASVQSAYTGYSDEEDEDDDHEDLSISGLDGLGSGHRTRDRPTSMNGNGHHNHQDNQSVVTDVLDISRNVGSKVMTMQEPIAERTIFPSEAAVTSSEGLDSKTPEVVMHPTQAQPNQQLMSDEDLDAVGQFLVQGSCVGIIIWLFLLFNVYLLAPEDSYEYLTGMERQAGWTIVILLFATNTTRIIPLAFQKNGFQFLKSGIMVGSFTVQFIALVSNWIMVVFKTPVMIDPYTGMRIHLFRFAVWTPLSFLMTFLTEAIDLNWQSKASVHQSFHQHSYQVAWWHASFMALSTVCGGIFPFCKNPFIWWEVMIISWILFATIYLRFYQRYVRAKVLKEQQQHQLPTKSKQTRGPNFLLNEAVDRSRMSFQLICLCTCTWTLIALTFTLACFLPEWVPKDSFWASPELPLVVGTMLESVSKVYYLTMQLHVYDKVFDESARSARRLEEMRTLMSALWEASTDILVICAETDSFIHAVISPHPLLQSEVEEFTARRNTSSTMLEISKFNNTFVSFPMNLSEPVTREDAQRIQSQRLRELNMEFTERDTTRGKNLATLAKLAKRACLDEQSWHNNAATWSLQEMVEYNPNTDSEIPVQCEAKVTTIDSGGVLLVLRDVQERYQRFEVEKALLEEVIVRKKDAEAIRFTRHEVKNGLLAAIGIVDGLKEQMQKHSAGADDSHMDDLDAALKEILEAILDNAMIREVVYEGYVPRRENVDLVQLLDPKSRERSSCGSNLSDGGGSKRHFPLFASPEPFPQLLLDPQLMRKIYQNAVSNACKYGKKDGDVKTFLTYDSASHIFRMEVFNLPGYNHEALVRLSQEESERVFQESTQLPINQRLDTKEGKLVSARSAGDGAWIMQKCAECLGGTCDINYTPNGTTLTFECPATVSDEWKEQQRSVASVPEEFKIPPTTWAIAVEDSPMQQKLLDRFLKQAGFPKEKCVVLGKTADEIYNFTDTIRDLMRENENDKFVLIIDENLDIVEGGAVTSTVSGSFSIHQLRKSMDEEDEARMLALIRSANDSVQEVEMYQSRAHGFLLKGPMKKGGLLEEIKPWWIRRFRKVRTRRRRTGDRRGVGRNGSGSGGRLMSNMSSSDFNHDDAFGITRERIMEFVTNIDALCGYRPLVDGHSSGATVGPGHSTDWQPIRYKLLLLNIDLKINSDRDLLCLAAKAIDDLTSQGGAGGVPDNLLHQWMEIRDLVTKGVEDTAVANGTS
ncbi:expressed unknown protein [Seminavis robusta]|uniref:Uncharacterized protein n=1 Tax=Seminavis robusta TaxID=568900 RepID=A0A9N8DGC2_9STRA|nr:expressed unknown protein [Seminavis robusta]|eukprot:Sro138_g064650.1 n/a (1336) ;mRNA; f:24460-28904